MNIWSILDAAGAKYPDNLCVVDGEKRFTYQSTLERVKGLAGFFSKNGLLPKMRISIIEDNSYAFFETYFATAALGAVLNPLNHRLSAREIAFILKDAGSRWLVANSRFASKVGEILSFDPSLEGLVWIDDCPSIKAKIDMFEYEDIVEGHLREFRPNLPDEDQIAHLYYTSGTTGRPKGVMLTHSNVCKHAQCAIEEIGLGAEDVWGHIAPMFHLADAWATFAITWVGGRHVMVPRFDPHSVLSAIQKEKITITNLIPTMLNLMIKYEGVDHFDLGSLRVLLSGGAPIAPELVRLTMEIFGCDYIQTYGMTETSPYLTLSILKDHLKSLPPEQQLFYKSKTGRPFKAVELKVVDEGGKEVRPDDQQVGEIWVKGQTVTPGYWNLPDETNAAFQDGWLRTGDLAVLDKEGYVNIVDRKKDMIVTGGENVYSTEVENILYKHPGVLEAAVFGVADEVWGEKVVAAVVKKPGKSIGSEELIRFCKQNLAAYKTPKSIQFTQELPKTGSGKIHKKMLRNMYGKTNQRG